jgi:transcriptional regulator with XRE-family HTH domain
MRIPDSTARKTFQDRLNYLMQYWGVKTEDFFKDNNLDLKSVKRLDSSPNNVEPEIISAVEKKDPNVDLNWLILGRGDFMKTDVASDVSDYSDINQRVKDLRVQHGLSQEEMASIMGVARTTYANIERGKQGVTIEGLRRLKKKFEGLTYLFLIDGDKREEQRAPGYVDALEDYNNKLKQSNDALITAIQALTSK